MGMKPATRVGVTYKTSEVEHVLWKTEYGYIITSSSAKVLANETYAFHADEHGQITDLMEIGRAYSVDQHEEALRDAGYEPKRHFQIKGDQA